MKMFLTRLGVNSKVVVTGDKTQIDLPEAGGLGADSDRAHSPRHRRDLVLLPRRRRCGAAPAGARDHPGLRRGSERVGNTEQIAIDVAGRTSPLSHRARPLRPRLTWSGASGGGRRCPFTFVGRDRMRDLNARWKGSRRATDVLAFSLPGPGGGLTGDVYICPWAAAREARRRSIALREELLRLVVHGMLHVLGWEHPDDDGRERVDDVEATGALREGLGVIRGIIEALVLWVAPLAGHRLHPVGGADRGRGTGRRGRSTAPDTLPRREPWPPAARPRRSRHALGARGHGGRARGDGHGLVGVARRRAPRAALPCRCCWSGFSATSCPGSGQRTSRASSGSTGGSCSTPSRCSGRCCPSWPGRTSAAGRRAAFPATVPPRTSGRC